MSALVGVKETPPLFQIEREREKEMAPTKDDLILRALEKQEEILEKLLSKISESSGKNGSNKAPITAWISVGAILIGAILSIGVMANKLDNALSLINQTQTDLKVERERVNELRLDVARSNARNDEILKQVASKGGK